jgi:hypothetical protein
MPAAPRLWNPDGGLSRSRGALTLLREHLRAELSGRVENLTIRRPEWSKGGGLHFGGRWRATGAPVLGKMGVGPNELYWTQQLARAEPELMPMLFAAGECLGDLAINWIVLEHVRFGPLGFLWQGEEFTMTLEAGVRFQRAAQTVPFEGTPTMNTATIRTWLAPALALDPHGRAAGVAARLEEEFAWVASVCGLETCHHDLHLANVVTRTPPPARSRGLLIDVAAVIQPWAFDAAYLQALNWGDPHRLGWRDLIPRMASLRREHGLPVPSPRNLKRLEEIVLTWFAFRLEGGGAVSRLGGTH